MIDETLITVNNCPTNNNIIEVEISAPSNDIEINFTPSTEKLIENHNKNSTAHLTIFETKADKSITYNKTQVDELLYSKSDKQPQAKTIKTNYTISSNDFLIFADATESTFNITIQNATECPGKEVFIKKIDSSNNLIRLIGEIENIINTTLGPKEDDITIISDGTKWFMKGF